MPRKVNSRLTNKTRGTRNFSNYNNTPNRNNNNNNYIFEFAKMGFGLGLGFLGVQILAMLLAMCFFVPGFIIVNREQAKEKRKEESSTGMKILGYILMAIGAIIGVGFLGTFLGELGSDFGSE